MTLQDFGAAFGALLVQLCTSDNRAFVLVIAERIGNPTSTSDEIDLRCYSNIEGNEEITKLLYRAADEVLNASHSPP